MKCLRCTHQNPLDVKFCSDCGQRMGTLCSGCNSLNLPESNFCHQCGQFLPKTNALFCDEMSSMCVGLMSKRLDCPTPSLGSEST
ncbi:MAG: zinc ribbon domain-containing protein [Gammaproteobacteria bacterium]|nr:zinc ribbon domain-containing protein [Gammaproteobacteria bacterium]